MYVYVWRCSLERSGDMNCGDVCCSLSSDLAAQTDKTVHASPRHWLLGCTKVRRASTFREETPLVGQLRRTGATQSPAQREMATNVRGTIECACRRRAGPRARARAAPQLWKQ